METCREAQSLTALTGLRREQRQLRAELDAEVDRRAEAERAHLIQPEDMTAEEWAARVRADVASTPDSDLELYVHEWLSRNGLTLVVEDGHPRLHRVAS